MIKTWCCLLLLVFTHDALAQPLRVAGGYIEGLVEPFEQGSYSEILQYLNARHGVRISHKTYPFSRVQHMFDRGDLDCAFPADKGIYWGNDPVFESMPIQTVNAYLYSKPNAPAYTGLAQLENKWVGLREGSVLPAGLDTRGIKLEQVGSLEANIKRLLVGRLNAIIAYDKDMEITQARMQLTELAHSKPNPLWQHNDGLLCHDSAKNREQIRAFDQALMAIKNSGVLQQLLSGVEASNP